MKLGRPVASYKLIKPPSLDDLRILACSMCAGVSIDRKSRIASYLHAVATICVPCVFAFCCGLSSSLARPARSIPKFHAGLPVDAHLTLQNKRVAQRVLLASYLLLTGWIVVKRILVLLLITTSHQKKTRFGSIPSNSPPVSLIDRRVINVPVA